MLSLGLVKSHGLSRFPGVKKANISTQVYSWAFRPFPKPSPTASVSGPIELFIDGEWITSPDGTWGNATKARAVLTSPEVYSTAEVPAIVEGDVVIGAITLTFTVKAIEDPDHVTLTGDVLFGGQSVIFNGDSAVTF
jgi:hypothetical protein